MTPEQIKARCSRVTVHVARMIGEDCTHGYITEQCQRDVEELYREAMAKGLEMAAVKAMGWREEDPPEDVSIDVWKYFGSQRELLAAQYREQVNTLKEPS